MEIEVIGIIKELHIIGNHLILFVVLYSLFEILKIILKEIK